MAPEMHTRPMFDRSTQREMPVVLLIDDDLVSREVTATILTMSGYTVHTAVSGAGSLESWRHPKLPAGRDPHGRADARPERR